MIGLVAGLGCVAWKATAEETAAAPDANASPIDIALKAPLGSLHNPYNSKIADIAAAGKKAYLSASCNGCHGGGGGGGMCPPLTNQAWNYGSTDDALFRLIVLGSNCKDYAHCVENVGMKRAAKEVVSFPMPAQGQVSKTAPAGQTPPLKTADDVWKIIAFIRSINPSSLTDADKAAAQ